MAVSGSQGKVIIWNLSDNTSIRKSFEDTCRADWNPEKKAAEFISTLDDDEDEDEDDDEEETAKYNEDSDIEEDQDYV